MVKNIINERRRIKRMKTFEELRRERSRLLSEKEVRDDFRARDQEHKSIKREIIGLRHEKKIRFVKRIGRGVSWFGSKVGKGISAVGEQYARAEESRRQQPRKVKRVRKVKRIKKIKKQSPQTKRPVRRVETFY